MGRVKERYVRQRAEKRFSHIYQVVEGEHCVYCGIPNDSKFDHQPSVYVLHRFADGNLVTKRQIKERFGECKLVPCCTICNMGLGAYNGVDDNDRRSEIVNWFLADSRFPEDTNFLDLAASLIDERLDGRRGTEVYSNPWVGRVIYINALMGFVEGHWETRENFPDWLKIAQHELWEWLRLKPKRKAEYFLEMAMLESYELLPHARDDPRGQFQRQH